MKNFLIKKNNHYSSGINIGIVFKDKIEFGVKFSDNCLYTIEDNDIYDINKLYGIATSYYHHKSSARIGWRCLDKENIEILTYTYDNWKRLESKILGYVKPNEYFECKITISDDIIYEFIKDDYYSSVIDNVTNSLFKIKYRLYPYFGGNKCSPHNMNILIDDK